MAINKSVYPYRLKSGSTIGLISPAGLVKDQAQIETGIGILQNCGFRVKYSQQIPAVCGYLAAEDTMRAKEFHNMWNDEQVDALMAIRGGYGSLRMINLLDMKFLQSSPKLLIGFSDITVLLNGIWQHTGIVSLHGPVVHSLPETDTLSLRYFLAALAGELDEYNFSNRIEVLRPGNSRGKLLGGNLTTIIHLLGTPWEIPSNGVILILEDTGEPMYKIDRMLTHLSHSGKLKNLSGIILGCFDSGDGNTLETIRLQEQVWNRILELTTDTQFPIWGNFPIGHQRENISLPIGLDTTMNSASGMLLFTR